MLAAAVVRFIQPRNSLPCVGLVVLGGCLTMIAFPDEPAARRVAMVEQSSQPELPTVIVDPGHGGNDEGTKWYGVAEREMTLDLGYRVERLLKTAGFPTLMTRRENVYVSLEDRVRMANRIDDALFLSLHFNSDSTGASTGIETFYARRKAPPELEWTWIGFFNRPEPVGESDTGEVLAGAVHAALANRTEARNRGIHPSNFYVVHHTKHPAVLVECGFLSNTFEMTLLRQENYRERIAEGIVEGVMSYQKLRSKPNRTPQPRFAQAQP